MAVTFLDIINKVLTAIDALPVSQIDDTVESEQVADIVRRAYDDLLTHRDWEFLRKEGTLTPTYDKPNTMYLPDDCMNALLIKYDKKEIKYLDPIEFRALIDLRNTASSNVNLDGIYTDRNPTYYTSFDGFIITFDAYNSNDSANLLESKSYVYYTREPNELFGANDVPDMPKRMYNVLVDYAISLAMNELKNDTQNALLYERKYKTALSRMIRWAKRLNQDTDRYDLAVDYGRKRRF